MTRRRRILLGNLVFIALCHPQLSSSQPSDSICSRTDVLFCTGFEESDWRGKWDDYDGNPSGSNDLLTDPGPFNISGNHVMRLRSPAGARGGADLESGSGQLRNSIELFDINGKRITVDRQMTGAVPVSGCIIVVLKQGDRVVLTETLPVLQ